MAYYHYHVFAPFRQPTQLNLIHEHEWDINVRLFVIRNIVHGRQRVKGGDLIHTFDDNENTREMERDGEVA